MSDSPASAGWSDTLLADAMSFARDNPDLANCVITALLWALGDCIAQMLERRAKMKQTHLPLAQSPDSTASSPSAVYGAPLVWRFDWLRLLRLASFAGLLFAPVTKRWFEFLEAAYPGTGMVVALKRMATDQICYSICVISSLFMWTGLWESGGSLTWALSKLRANLWPALKANWMVWPAVQLVNLSVVPLDMRMIVGALVNIPWTAYLAMKAGATTKSGSKSGVRRRGKNTGGQQAQRQSRVTRLDAQDAALVCASSTAHCAGIEQQALDPSRSLARTALLFSLAPCLASLRQSLLVVQTSTTFGVASRTPRLQASASCFE